MKKANFITVLLCLLFSINTYSQEKTKQQIKEEKKQEQQRQLEAMIDAKNFVFTANRAMPLGMRSVDLTTRSNVVKFLPDSIMGDMPYFGESHGGGAYGTGDAGIKFEGVPEEYTITKGEKGYEVEAKIKGNNNDVYQLYLSINFGGYASLSISSNYKSSISYSGEIYAPEVKQ
jgi:hypothetical protein